MIGGVEAYGGIYYCHKGSFSQPKGKPSALRSISGKSTKSQRSLASISLLGEMMLRKYLMMQRSKYVRRVLGEKGV